MKKLLQCWWHSSGFRWRQLMVLWLGVATLSVVVGVGPTIFFDQEWEVLPIYFFPAVVTVWGVVIAVWMAIAEAPKLMAIRRFRKAFGCLPATTGSGRDAMTAPIREELSRRAKLLDDVYRLEASHCPSASLRNHQGTLYEAATKVAEAENVIRRVVKLDQRQARRRFYGAFDAATSKHLPLRFTFNEGSEYSNWLPEEKMSERMSRR